MTDRDRLIELIADYTENVTARDLHSAEFDNKFADHLLANGVFILPEDLRATEDFSISAFIEAMQMYKEKDRYIKPPCKVGDKVFIIEKEYRLNKVEHKIITCEIEFIYVSSKTKRYHTKKLECPYMDNGFNFRPKDIGKTVFLTKEEAEKALKEREGK